MNAFRGATAIGLALGIAVGLAGFVANVASNLPVAIVWWVVSAIAGARLGALAEQELLRRKEIREGRYRRYAARHPGFRRWTWPLSVGAACGLVVFLSSDQASGLGLILWAPLGAGIGVFVAAGIELLVVGPGEGDRRRLGAFVYDNRWHVGFMLGAGLAFGLWALRWGPAEAATGIGAGWLLGYGAWIGGRLLLTPFDGGRDLVPRRWFGSRAAIELDLDEYIVESLPPRNVVRGTLQLHALVGVSELRVELASRTQGEVRTPESGGSGRFFDVRDVVAVARIPVTAVGDAKQLTFMLHIPGRSAPSLALPTLSVEWSVRAVAVTPRKLDATDDARLVVVPPRTDVQRSAAPIVVPGAAMQGETFEGEFLPAGRPVRATTPFEAPMTPRATLVRRTEILVGLGTEADDVIATAVSQPSKESPGAWRFTLTVPPDAAPSVDVEDFARVSWFVGNDQDSGEFGRQPIVIHTRLRAGDALPVNERRPARPLPVMLRLIAMAMMLGAGFAVASSASGPEPEPTVPGYLLQSGPIFATFPPIDIPSIDAPGPLLPSIRPCLANNDPCPVQTRHGG